LRLKILKKLRTASLYSEITGSYKKSVFHVFYFYRDQEMVRESTSNNQNTKEKPHEQFDWDEKDRQNEKNYSPGRNSASYDHIPADNKAEPHEV